MIDLGDRFELERELGAGGFGTTYAALDRQTGRRVAVKVLDLRRVEDWKSVELFEREAKVLRSLDHPGIPAYVDFRPLEADKAAYLVQTLAPGENLETLLQTRRFTEPELVDLARRVLGILDYLTRLHPVVVHRDIKPANILLDEDGSVSLVDFGAVQDVANATMSGGSTVAGTFGYMAPEQLRGVATPGSDLYGLGMTLVHLATGVSPADLETTRLKPDFRPKVHFSDGFEEIIDRMIEPVPDDRFQTAAQVLVALDGLREGGEPEPGWIATLLGRSRRDSTPSVEQIAEQRRVAEAGAEREAKRLAERESKSAALAPAKEFSRATFTDEGDTAELAIRPSQYWRGREAHAGVLVVLGPMLAVGVGSAYGTAGTIVALVATALVGALLWIFAPVWRLRATNTGDFVLYTRSPDSPKWAGRVEQLEFETVKTARDEPLAWIYFRQPSGRIGKHFYPISWTDAAEFKSMARWAGRYRGRR
ncbi:MAG: serine/threonine-protein kinase [Nannocystaceae bacterium]